ncbi:unnamed protein product [Peronospora belbahrii]|uniref:DNA primase large subunit C-terminal domain-containing protein n=1 Tax=Peronospora belbahrii TaxID=622444 RepID=A0ABN8D2W8_9STRA|nr:unnamed protein product [Peronospora belbahrii]
MSSRPVASSLSFYRTSPQQRVALDEFELLGNKRAQLLNQISSQWHLRSTIQGRNKVVNGIVALDEVALPFDADLLSHYALRLAFCRQRCSIDWNWLITAEEKLLAFRLGNLPPIEAITLLLREGIEYEKLLNASNSERDTMQQGIYRVPFTDAPTLVKYREVIIHDGFCLVPLCKMNIVAVYRFRKCLEEQMHDLHCVLPAQSLELERLSPILDGFVAKARVSVGSMTKKAVRLKLDVKEIDQIAEKHFPLCMKQLHRKLRENHHLKYDGRVQYRMFLKGAGFSVHECIQFFRSEFIKKMPAVKFDKEYTYHIRHSYGLEGSRKDYAPLDCERIISGSAPSHGKYHGCPFKHWDHITLQDELRRHGLSLQTSMVITQQASTGHCQSACRAFFDETHTSTARQFASQTIQIFHPDTSTLSNGISSTNLIMHPNLYLSASMSTVE